MAKLRVEVLSSAFLGLLTILTVTVPQWIEVVTGVDPDAGSGLLEWAAVVVCMSVAAVIGLDAGRRLRTRHATP